MGESSSALHPVALAAGPMLLGVAAALTAPAAPWLSAVACWLADPFLVGLVAVARWAAGLPGASLTLSGPLRAAPAAALAVVLAVAAAAARRRPDEAGGRAGSRASEQGARPVGGQPAAIRVEVGDTVRAAGSTRPRRRA
jgi:hypothetical protein